MIASFRLTTSSSLCDVNEELGPVSDLSTGRSFLFCPVPASWAFLAGADAEVDDRLLAPEEEATAVDAEFEELLGATAEELGLAPFSLGRGRITPETRPPGGRETLAEGELASSNVADLVEPDELWAAVFDDAFGAVDAGVLGLLRSLDGLVIDRLREVGYSYMEVSPVGLICL